MKHTLSHSTRCVEGRLMRHDPQYDDPYLETDIGQCQECDGAGCDTLSDPCVDCGSTGECAPGCPSRIDDDDAAERAWDRQQEHLMECGPGPSLLEQQQEAMKLK